MFLIICNAETRPTPEKPERSWICRFDRCVFKRRGMSQLSKLGGKKGYYYDNILWKLLGFIDRLLNGARLNRERRHPLEIRPGDAVCFSVYWMEKPQLF